MSDSERAHSGVGGPVEISPRGPFGSDRVAFHAYSGGSAYQRRVPLLGCFLFCRVEMVCEMDNVWVLLDV